MYTVFLRSQHPGRAAQFYGDKFTMGSPEPLLERMRLRAATLHDGTIAATYAYNPDNNRRTKAVNGTTTEHNIT